MPPSASRIKEGQGSLYFLLLPFDIHGIQLQGKGLQHLTFEVLQHISISPLMDELEDDVLTIG